MPSKGFIAAKPSFKQSEFEFFVRLNSHFHMILLPTFLTNQIILEPTSFLALIFSSCDVMYFIDLKFSMRFFFVFQNFWNFFNVIIFFNSADLNQVS